MSAVNKTGIHRSTSSTFQVTLAEANRKKKKKKREKKCTARTRNSFTGSFIRGIKNERLARMETGSVCQIGFLDIKRVARSVVSNLRPFSIRNRSRCMTENRHCLTQTTLRSLHTCNSSHLVATNFLRIHFSVHNRREFFKKKKSWISPRIANEFPKKCMKVYWPTFQTYFEGISWY